MTFTFSALCQHAGIVSSVMSLCGVMDNCFGSLKLLPFTKPVFLTTIEWVDNIKLFVSMNRDRWHMSVCITRLVRTKAEITVCLPECWQNLVFGLQDSALNNNSPDFLLLSGQITTYIFII
ncbi:hypothetical protein GOODEAATRI_016487 [Goodea atripinnis]|uniref:Uncharacterized protein n=1 Tax=Goodea atripinnis TaxID=208336 RepID=A0ABV0NKU4_9TELE